MVEYLIIELDKKYCIKPYSTKSIKTDIEQKGNSVLKTPIALYD